MIQRSGTTQHLVVYGAGDHGLVVAEAAEAAGHIVAGFVDDALERGHIWGWWQVLADDAAAAEQSPFIVAIGANEARQTLTYQLQGEHRASTSIIHPTAWVSLSAEIGDGVFIGPQAVVHSEAIVEAGAIINSSAVVEHHNRIRAFSHVAPGVVLGGRCEVGEKALVGLGARVLPDRAVGAEATVGAGGLVDRDVAAQQTVMGLPARVT